MADMEGQDIRNLAEDVSIVGGGGGQSLRYLNRRSRVELTWESRSRSCACAVVSSVGMALLVFLSTYICVSIRLE